MKSPDIRTEASRSAMGRARTLGVSLGLLLTAMAVQAQSVRIVQATSLRTDRGLDTAAVAALDTNATVNLLQLSGGWAQVETEATAGTRRGWLRASYLDLRPPEVAAESRIETGRRASGAVAVTLGSRALPPRNNRHALIIGIGHYKAEPARPVDSLAGLDLDMASALVMARSLQVPDDNITLLRDEAATNEGIAEAIRQLGERALPGDRVFIYWSGHGSRYFDSTEGGCVESLVPYDLKDVTNKQLARWLKPIGEKADKMLVVYDACHSGGIAAAQAPVTRGVSVAALQAKFTPAADACQVASNVRTRSLSSAVVSLGLSGQDVVHISSSRSDEISLQNPRVGGLATSALRECLLGDARDTDGSGSISAQELADCAQAKVDQALVPYPQFGPPHLTLAGNRDFVPAWFARSGPAPAASVVATLPDVAGSSSTTAGSASTPAPPPRPPSAPSPPTIAVNPPPAADAVVPMSRVLEQINDQRDSKRAVTVTATRGRMRIGADALGFNVTSSHAGHVYVAMLGSDGKTLTLLFPNALDAGNEIRAGETIALPRPRWQLTAGGPPGIDKLLVLVTEGPRDLPAVRGNQAGPFVQPLTDAQGRSQLQWMLGTNARQDAARGCATGCSDAFGSTIVDVEEY